MASYFSRYMQPDEDFLAWDVVRRFGVPESKARELIAEFKGRRKVQPASRRAEVEEERPLTCACPLCGRSGADRNLILLKTEDPELSQLTLGDAKITPALRKFIGVGSWNCEAECFNRSLVAILGEFELFKS